MKETIAASTALGHPIEREYADLQIERTYPMGAYQPSTLVDWLAGKELESRSDLGRAAAAGEESGLLLPHLERLYQTFENLGSPAFVKAGIA